MPSQLAGVRIAPTEGSGKAQSGDDMFRNWSANMKRPNTDYLVLDTTRPVEVCVEAAIAYVATAS
jgi:hypothetical protein